ncbi:rab-GTPase-TBC domain-containing protein [Blastocladiella britannica]|nr:rab-GTPase-TBC domain-containing protein [Blastocladiella britannica]
MSPTPPGLGPAPTPAPGGSRVFGAGMAFTSSASALAAKFASVTGSSPSTSGAGGSSVSSGGSGYSSASSGGHKRDGSIGSPRFDRRGGPGGSSSGGGAAARIKTRDQLVDRTSDAWGEIDDEPTVPAPLSALHSAPPAHPHPASYSAAAPASSSSTTTSSSLSSMVPPPPVPSDPSATSASAGRSRSATATSGASSVVSMTVGSPPSSGSAAGLPPMPPQASRRGSRATPGPSSDGAEADRAAADEVRRLTALATRHAKFDTVLSASTIDLTALRKLCWSGIPPDLRPTCWPLLLGYAPLQADRRAAALMRKRADYADIVAQSFPAPSGKPADKALAHQIHIDVLRTRPAPAYADERLGLVLERVLYCWAMRHPASGYVQGINDLVTPIVSVLLDGVLAEHNVDDLASLPTDALTTVEADAFWSLTKLIDGIQDNYTASQPGIQKLVGRLKDLVARIDASLSAHLVKEGIEFIQFAFRWMNCLLMREVSHTSTIRMWDTYLSEEGDLGDFHVYVCAAFLVKFSKDLKTKDFADIMLFLQSPPTKDWGDKDIELLLSEAFMWKSLFHNSPSHLVATK